MAKRRLIGEMMVRKGLVNEQQVDRALEYQQKSSEDLKLGEILVKFGFVDHSDVLRALGEQFDVPVVNLQEVQPQGEALEAVPRNTAKMHNIMPLRLKDGSLTIAIADLDLCTIDNLQFILNQEIKPVLAHEKAIEDAIERYYGSEESTVDNMLREFTESEVSFAELTDETGGEGEDGFAEDGAIIRLVNLLITEAVRARASDVHIEPLKNRLRVRYRVDGMCREVESPPKRLQNSLIARLKLMADMDLAEKRRPQDGRILMKTAGRQIDLRVSDIPTTDGESIVMRILDKASVKVSLTELGFHEDDLSHFEEIIRQPNGIFLVTGPTGSGKTTTLYSALNALNRPDTKILTAEDPVEYHLSGINQTQVQEDIDRTFPAILRAMLRQAPEVILVGEIRDAETAEIAIRAALTGHLVFSTLHTNDAPTAIPRLIDLGVKPFLVASSVVATMAQRLVRTICKSCKEPHEYPEKYYEAVGWSEEELKDVTLYRGEGCSDCSGTGYRGRIAIFEVMEMSQELRDLAFEKAPAGELRDKARAQGMMTLMEDGLRKVQAGTTTLEEVLRVAGGIEDID
ncbi:MAG: Flp pilus assembly complex ATPase component TadA [Planctomycetes bacterium]|nr:Flp pilus assembly complex ATPase component TadA [Planctomycetota bacterium]